MEIQNGISVVHQAASWDVAVAKDHVAPRVPGRKIAHETDQMEPVGIAVIVAIHNFHLPKMDTFAANIDIRGCLVIKP